ncbi:MAG: PAS domain-containing protein [Planctomycetia bacterium]|nr:PAS domain-containing protein [Planctomycetia bacterium]
MTRTSVSKDAKARLAPAQALEFAALQYPGIIWTTDADGVITSAVGTGMTQLGMAPNQTVGMTLEEYFGSNSAPVLDSLRRVLAGEKASMEQYWSGRDFESTLYPLHDGDGNVVGCLGITTDVTERKRSARMMPHYVAQMRSATERTPDYVIQIDATGRLTYAEGASPGYNPDIVVGTQIAQWIRPETLPIVQAALQRLLTTAEPQSLEIPAIRPGNTDGWFDVRLRPVTENTQVVGAVVVVYDITDRKVAELQLREAQEELERRVAQRTEELTVANFRLQESEQRLQSILDNTTAVVFVKDLQGRYMLVNSQFRSLFLGDSIEAIGKTDLEVFPDQPARAFQENDRQVLDAGIALQFDEVAPHEDGPHNYISVKFPLRDSSGAIHAICGISTDITDRKQAEEKLRRDEQLLRRLLDLRERERQMVAYEIHDGLVQDVVAAKMLLEGHCVPHGDSVQLVQQEYDRVRNLLIDAIDEGRRLISELRPPILDEQGIVGSIEYLVAEHAQKSGLRVGFKHRVDFDRLAPLFEGSVFRIVQEALNNVSRHSQAASAEISLAQLDRRLILEIRDEGLGFEPDLVPADRFGIRGIVERARLFGGSATIESRPGKGTLIVVKLPISVAPKSQQISQHQTSQTAEPAGP